MFTQTSRLKACVDDPAPGRIIRGALRWEKLPCARLDRCSQARCVHPKTANCALSLRILAALPISSASS
jgi:hypothetical protein